MLAGIVRDCQAEMARNFLQQRTSAVDDNDIHNETFPSLFVEPRNLTDESLSLDPSYNESQQQGRPGLQTDSGYESWSRIFESDSSRSPKDESLQGMSSLWDCTFADLNNFGNSQTMTENNVWPEVVDPRCFDASDLQDQPTTISEHQLAANAWNRHDRGEE